MSDSSIRTGIVGATGYAGMDLVRMIMQHPHFHLTYLAGARAREESFAELFPNLAHLNGPSIQKYDLETCLSFCDLVFVALPSGESGKVAVDLWRHGLRVIDLSGDLRLPSELYQEWYHLSPCDQDAVSQAVYGLSEVNRSSIQGATLVSNPGCYATAAILAAKPLDGTGWIDVDQPIIIDAKSGVTGAGRGAKAHLQFGELADDFYPYKVTRHQHIPEIEQALHSGTTVVLTTQLLPVQRGIFASLYISLSRDITEADVYERYQLFYESSPFVHVLPLGAQPHLKSVRGSNHVHLAVAKNERGRVLQVFSVIDNLQKGAAGQALQNANLMFDFHETCGLTNLSTWM